MRSVSYALVVIAAIALGTIQMASSAALRPGALPAGVVSFVGSWQPSRVQLPIMRYVLGSWAVARGDVSLGAAYAASLPAGADRDVLEALVAQRRGDTALATSKYLDAGDLPRLESQVDALAAGGRISDALALQTMLLARLAERHAQNDTIAEATYRLGVLDQDMAYAQRPGRAARDLWQGRSRDAYVRAFALAPLEDRYGLALANQDLNVGDLAAARATFERVHELDPASVDPLTGLADAAIRARDYAGARAYLEQAGALAPGSAAVAAMRAHLPKG